jgi:hypothetical protein
MTRVPSLLITEPESGLIGCAAVAQELLRGAPSAVASAWPICPRYSFS